MDLGVLKNKGNCPVAIINKDLIRIQWILISLAVMDRVKRLKLTLVAGLTLIYTLRESNHCNVSLG